KLSDLLDTCIFFTDIKEPITREKFEKDFTQLVEVPFMYFLNIATREDNSIADDYLKRFQEYGAGAKGAFELIEMDILEYHLGMTLDFEEDIGKITIEDLIPKIGEMYKDASPEMKKLILERFDDKGDPILLATGDVMPTTRDKFHKELEEALTAHGTIELLTTCEKQIDYINIAEPKGLFGADEADNYEAVKIDEIMQSVETGRVYVLCEDNDGLREFEFDFVGTKEELYKFMIEERERHILEVANLNINKSVNHANR
ncbi:MAG: hypothetical protein J7L21_01855, partial [Sulfurimonas sp.]|nr:hypothetical protein [Sulfurimonas sp.]